MSNNAAAMSEDIIALKARVFALERLLAASFLVLAHGFEKNETERLIRKHLDVNEGWPRVLPPFETPREAMERDGVSSDGSEKAYLRDYSALLNRHLDFIKSQGLGDGAAAGEEGRNN